MNKDLILSFYRELQSVYDDGLKLSTGKSFNLSFAKHTFKAHYLDSKTDEFYSPALSHLMLPSSTNHDLDVYVMEGKTTGLNLPAPCWDWNKVHPHGEIYRDEELILTFESWCGVLRMYNRIEQKAYIWIRSISDLPQWMRSFPLRSIVDWYFEPTGIQPVHSGGIALGQNGVMLTGKGGSGKSSTCLSCLNHSELKYLGDDFMLVDCESGKDAYSLYNVAKVEFDNLSRFKFLEGYKKDFKVDDEKYQIFINQIMPDKLTNEFNIDAIFLPKITGSKSGRLVKTDSSNALMALAPSTISLLKGNRERTFSKVSSLVKKTPIYFLELSTEFERNPEIIYKYLES
ncbi:MAG: hypothetical protein ABJF11_05905 [Reichenbachiella sp.]|uniref:hypothetical protein n=1 Tax=Reichenbachiella sp. TaxID=2184521 RepID=UPI00326676CE